MGVTDNAGVREGMELGKVWELAEVPELEDLREVLSDIWPL